MKINWRVRLKNKQFWIAIIPAALILVQNCLKSFGIDFDITVLSENALSIVNSLFAVLAILGIVADPTTCGISDSEKAMTYEEPF